MITGVVAQDLVFRNKMFNAHLTKFYTHMTPRECCFWRNIYLSILGGKMHCTLLIIGTGISSITFCVTSSNPITSLASQVIVDMFDMFLTLDMH